MNNGDQLGVTNNRKVITRIEITIQLKLLPLFNEALVLLLFLNWNKFDF